MSGDDDKGQDRGRHEAEPSEGLPPDGLHDSADALEEAKRSLEQLEALTKEAARGRRRSSVGEDRAPASPTSEPVSRRPQPPPQPTPEATRIAPPPEEATRRAAPAPDAQAALPPDDLTGRQPAQPLDEDVFGAVLPPVSVPPVPQAPRRRRPHLDTGGLSLPRLLAPAVFLIAVIAVIAIVFASGVVGGNKAKTPVHVRSSSPHPSATKPVALKRPYIIKAGDTLLAIANANHTTVDGIMLLNPSLDPTNLTIGKKIWLPPAGK